VGEGDACTCHRRSKETREGGRVFCVISSFVLFKNKSSERRRKRIDRVIEFCTKRKVRERKREAINSLVEFSRQCEVSQVRGRESQWGD
jgi:hypothetical protein